MVEFNNSTSNKSVSTVFSLLNSGSLIAFFHRSDTLWLYVSIYPWSDIRTRNYPKVSLFLLQLLLEGFISFSSRINYWLNEIIETFPWIILNKTVNFGALQAKLQIKVEQRSYNCFIF